MKSIKTAFVYDWLDTQGGAERVLETLSGLFPDADWYTSYARPGMRYGNTLTTSFIQNTPIIKDSRVLSIPFYPFAFESFDFTGYDSVISITSSFAKGIITRPETKHISYMLTPPRFLWGMEDTYMSPLSRFVAKPYLRYLKTWDYVAAQRPDHIIAISHTVAQRIQEHYHRDPDVLFPPFDIPYWEDRLRENKPPIGYIPNGYFLIVSRLEKYKKVDLAIQTFNRQPDKHLIIVGTGRERNRLRRMARPNIHFFERLTDAELAYLYGHAKGFIMPQEEDFGYTSLEAQLCSCPVIAYNKGGAQETVIHGKTGYLFEDQSVACLQEALENFSRMAYTIDKQLQLHGSETVERFSKDHFRHSFMKKVSSLL